MRSLSVRLSGSGGRGAPGARKDWCLGKASLSSGITFVMQKTTIISLCIGPILFFSVRSTHPKHVYLLTTSVTPGAVDTDPLHKPQYTCNSLIQLSDTKCYLAGDACKPPQAMPWYPNQLAWHMSFSRGDLRKMPVLAQLHEFMKRENDAGSITRQEAVSMVPPLFMDVQPHHTVRPSFDPSGCAVSCLSISNIMALLGWF